MTDIGKRVRIARGEMTQNELREKVGLKTLMAISNIETGVTQAPKMETLQKIADATGRSLQWILYGDDQPGAVDDVDAHHPDVVAYLDEHPETHPADAARLRAHFKRTALSEDVLRDIPGLLERAQLARLRGTAERPAAPTGGKRTMAERDAEIRKRDR